MRIRRKKHLIERIDGMRDVIIVADISSPDIRVKTGEELYFNYRAMFGNDNPVEIEIGAGKGGFIAMKAKENPNINYIAVELLSNVIVMAGDLVKKESLMNVKLFNCGAEYLSRYIKSGTVNAIYLNFSPPFPGKRYENRRLTNPVLIESYRNMLSDGGKIELKTDDKEFFEYSVESLKNGGFSVFDLSHELESGEEVSVQTEYEKKFRSLGFPIYFLRAVKQ